MVHFVVYRTIILYYGDSHCVKGVRIRSYSGPYFPVFSPNAGKYGTDNSEHGHFSRSVSFGEWYPAEDWAQMLLEVLGVKINIFRDFMQLNEPQCLVPAFKSWPLFMVILFRKDIFNVHEP